MNERGQHRRVPVKWPVEISRGDYSLVGRAVDVSTCGLCVASAPTAFVRGGDSYRVEMVANGGARRAVTGEVRYLASDRFGIPTDELLPLE